MPQHMAVSLWLTVGQTKIFERLCLHIEIGGIASLEVIYVCRKATGFPLCAATEPQSHRRASTANPYVQVRTPIVGLSDNDASPLPGTRCTIAA
jgi:hypothetical protein